MSASVFNDPILGRLFDPGQVARCFELQAEIDAMLLFETALAKVQENAGLIPQGAAQAIETAAGAFAPDLDALSEATRRDGVCVPELVRQLRKAVGEPHAQHVHFGATSQDVVDTSLVLRLKPALEQIEHEIAQVTAGLTRLAGAWSPKRLNGHTRMQTALPISVGDKIRNWTRPLQDAVVALEALRPRLLRLQFGGAVGTLDKLGESGKDVSDALAAELGVAPSANWHTQRGALAALAGWLSEVTGALGKIGQDISLMAQNEVSEIAISGGGGSSAMPHKQNPVSAELLVTLARYNAAQTGGMHQALIHENERSGAAWALEWMILPQMVLACGASLRTAGGLIGRIERIGAE